MGLKGTCHQTVSQLINALKSTLLKPENQKCFSGFVLFLEKKVQKTIIGILDPCRTRIPLGKSELILARTKHNCRSGSALPEAQVEEGRR